MDQKKKRLSILKKPVRYESSPTQTFTKSNRRISFSGIKSVKEFIPGDDKATIWGTSYEEEDGNQGSGVSNQDSCTVETSTSLAENSIGMKLRNRKIVPSLNTEDKENIAKEIAYDTTDVEVFATAGDSRTFNGTLDVTLNSFEIKKFVKTGHDGRTAKEIEMCKEYASPTKQLRVDADVSQNFDYSFITEEDRKMLLQNRIANKRNKAINKSENNESSEFLKELDKLKFEDPPKIEPRHVLSDKNQDDSSNMCLSFSPIKSMDLSKLQSNSNVRKTIVFQQGQMIASVETAEEIKNFNTTRIRRTALLNEDLILDTSILPRTIDDQRKSMQTLEKDEMVIETMNENSSMDRKQSDVDNKRKTIIFQRDHILSFEIDQQETTQEERVIQSNSPNRIAMCSPRGEKRQACFDENKSGKKLQIHKPRQTIIFDTSEKLDVDFQSKPSMLEKSKRTTQNLEEIDMEVEENKTMKARLLNIEANNGNQLNVLNRKTILFRKGEEVQSCSYKDQTINSKKLLQQKPRPSLIFDKADNFGNFNDIIDVDMEIDENSIGQTSTDVKTKIQSNPPSRKTIIFPEGEGLQSRVDKIQISDHKLIQNRSRQTMIFNNGEKIDDDVTNIQDMPINTKRITQIFKSLDIEVEQNLIKDSLNEDLLRSFNASESFGGQKICLNETNKVQQDKRQSVFITNDSLEETLNEPYSCTEEANFTQNQESEKNKKTVTHEPNHIGSEKISFELSSSKTATNNEDILITKNRKTIDKIGENTQLELSQSRIEPRRGNEKSDPVVVFDVTQSEKRERACTNFKNFTLDLKQNDERKTRLFNREEPMSGIDETMSANLAATIEQRISKNEARKTLIFQDGEPLESCEVEVCGGKSADNVSESALIIKRFERRKTKIFNDSELLDISKDESLSGPVYVSTSNCRNPEATQNNQLSNQSENKPVENDAAIYGIELQETKVQKSFLQANLSSHEIIPPVSLNGRIAARKTNIFEHGEAVEEINIKSIKKVSNDGKDIRKTILFHKDLDESGLAFLEPDNLSRSRNIPVVTSCNDDMEIDSLPSNQQQQNVHQASDSTRKTIIFSQAIKSNSSFKENVNQNTKSSNHSPSDGLLEFGNSQDIRQNILYYNTENIQEQGGEKLDNKSKYVVSPKGAVPKAINTNTRRKTCVFDDENMEIEANEDQSIFNHNALSKDAVNNGTSSKILFSLKPVEINELKSNTRNDFNEIQMSRSLRTSMLLKDNENNSFQKKLQAQLLENREENQESKTLNKRKVENNLLTTAKEAIIKEDLASSRENVVTDKIRASLKNITGRKTVVFQDGEHADLDESKKKQNAMEHNNILKNIDSKMDAPVLEYTMNRNSINDADPDISIDSTSSPRIVLDYPVKDRNKRKTMIFPDGEAIEEEGELVLDYITNNTEEQLVANACNTLNKNKTIENSVKTLNDKGLVRIENSMRKSVIIEKSPSKKSYLSRSDTEHLEYKPYNQSESPCADSIIIHATKNDDEMELDEQISRIEKEPNEMSSNNIKNRKTIYMNEDIGTAIETSFSSPSINKNNIFNSADQFSLGNNESNKNVIQSETNNHSTFNLPYESITQRKRTTQNESQRHNEPDKSRNETFAAHCETFVVNRNKRTCDSAESSTGKTFENNSSTTGNINPHLLRNLPQDPVYFSRTANFPMAGMESFQVTGSSFSYSPNSTAALCNIDPDQITGAGYMRTHKKNSASENTFYKQFKRDFAEITIDTIRESPDQYSKIEAIMDQDIEKTHIDLVDTIDTIEDSPEKVDACEASVLILHVTEAKENKENIQSINLEQQRSYLCRKCKNCQRTILNEPTFNETTLSDFNQAEDEPEVELDFSALDRLKGKPNFRQVWNKYQEQRLSDNFNATYEELILLPTGPSTEFLLVNSEEEFLEDLNKEMQSDDLTGAVCPTIMPLWFLFENRLKEKSCWNFDDLHLPIGVLECRHRSVRGIRILCKFNSQELYNESASELNFKRVWLERCNGYRNPSAIDEALQNEIFMRIPRELTGFCSTSSEFFTYLKNLESSFTKSKELVRHLLEETALNHAVFECDESNNCIIRKTVFNDTQPKYGIKIEFQIRIRNIEKICANDILLPPRSYFKDDIRTLPSGLEFVKSFLPNPVQFLK